MTAGVNEHANVAIAKTSIATRVSRLARLMFHLYRGLYILLRHFPHQTERRHGKEIRRWSRQLLAILGMRARTINMPLAWPARCMLISNHISWVDVFAILSVRHCVFVAKSEIRDWPFIGRLVAEVGTLFIERAKRSDARRANARIAAALNDGRIIAVCPEGTTNATHQLLRFHTALFQPAIEARATLQPVGLRYFDAAGHPSSAAAYIGDQTLLGSIWAIAGEPRMMIELRFGPTVDATGGDRRGLAEKTRTIVGALLEE